MKDIGHENQAEKRLQLHKTKMVVLNNFTGLIRANKSQMLCAIIQRYFSSGVVTTQKHVVAVGAGYGGVKVALGLQKAGIPFTLINPRDCMHHNLSALRAVCEPGE